MSLRKSGSDPTSITVPENTVHLQIGPERWCYELYKVAEKILACRASTVHRHLPTALTFHPMKKLATRKSGSYFSLYHRSLL